MNSRRVAVIAGALVMALTLPAVAGAREDRVGARPPVRTNNMSNRGGVVRGLHRADQVAGQHGDRGRDIAETRSNKAGKQRGLGRANDVAGKHGAQGRAHSGK